jgi:hypothetical protein
MKTDMFFSKLGLGLVIVVGLASSAPASNALLGLWRFNEASGDTAIDSSGLNHDGVLAVMAGETDIKPERVAGPPGFGGALSFTNNGDDTYPHSMVYIAPADVLKIGMTADDTWTITAWAYERSDGSGGFGGTYGRLFAQDGGLSLNFNSGANGDAQYYIWHNSVTDWQQGFGTGAAVVPVLDQWIHLALVYDGTNLTLYRNGNLSGQGGAKSAIPVHSAINHSDYGGYHGSIQIGTMPNMVNRNWNGMIDDFAVFSGALSESEVRTVMTGDFSAYLTGSPTIVQQPANQRVDQGLPATFTVVASSTVPLTYQWRFNEKDIAGATNSTLTVTNAQNSNAGTYAVAVHSSAGTTLSSNAVLTVLVPLPPRLIGLWRFDEGTGTNAYDSSGLTNNGVLTTDFGNVPTWVQSRTGFGTALQFVVDGMNRSYVDVPASDSLRFGMTANDTWTIAAWTYEASDGAGNFVSSYGRLFAQNGGYGLNFDSGSSVLNDPQYWIWHSDLGAWQQGFGAGAAVVPVLDQWVHLALVYDGASLTLYRNANVSSQSGAKASLPVHAGLDWPGYGSELQIGSINNSPPDHNWNGMIDDFAVFTGALSESQLRTVMEGDFTAFFNPVPLLSLTPSGKQVVVSWGFGTLQSSTNVLSGWQDVAGATSPLILDPTGANRFYRVRR